MSGMRFDSRKNILNCAVAAMTTPELRILLDDLGFGDDMEVYESEEYKAWDFGQWYRPDEHQLTDEEFHAKYSGNTKPIKDDGVKPGAA